MERALRTVEKATSEAACLCRPLEGPEVHRRFDISCVMRDDPSMPKTLATFRNGVPLLRRGPAGSPKPTLALVNRRRCRFRDEP